MWGTAKGMVGDDDDGEEQQRSDRSATTATKDITMAGGASAKDGGDVKVLMVCLG